MPTHVISQSGTPWVAAQDDSAPITGEYLYLIGGEGSPRSGRMLASGFFRGEAADEFDWEPPFDELVYIIAGHGTLTEDGVTRALAAGDLAFFPQGSKVRIRFDGPWSEVFAFIE